MAAIFQFPYLLGLPLLPSRRLIAIDAGSHSIKILLAEKAGKSIRIHREELIDLHEEGLLSREEIGPALRAIFEEMGDHPVALALPQHLPLSYVLDLTAGSKAVKQMIEAEALKNRDLRDSPVVYDCARLHPFGRHQNSFLVTLCKEEDTVQQIERLSLTKEDVCEVVAPATVLAAAYQTTSDPFGHVMLVDIGATGTLVTVCVGGQAVHSASFPIGGNLFTETIATKKNCSVEEAELLKHTTDLLRDGEVPTLTAIVDAWRKELMHVLEIWLRENAELNLGVASFKVILSGGGARQPGLIDYLNRDGGAIFARWPQTFVNQQTMIGEQFAIAFGTALQALGTGSPSPSLLPGSLRESWRHRRAHQHFLTGTFAVLVACLLLLVLGTWQKYVAGSRKEALLKQAELALGRADETEVLRGQLLSNYERVRPVLRREQYTLNALDALQSLEHSRSNRNLWYVLFSDPASYFGGPLTNGVISRDTSLFQPSLTPTTNIIPQRHGFIAELCINQEGEAMRQTLAQVVVDLKQMNLFTNVDTLPSDLRREVANTNVIVPDRHFALLLELAHPELLPVAKAANSTTTTNKPAVGGAEKPSNRQRTK